MIACIVRNAVARAPSSARALAVVCVAFAAAGGATTGHPPPIASDELAEAKTFPYYLLYWVGPDFEGHPVAAADGLRAYVDTVGDSVYYGDCVQSKGIFGGGTCLLPLEAYTLSLPSH